MPMRFEEIYGRGPDVSASAPGRVNLIGEHTDYNGGRVLPAPIPRETKVEVARRADRKVRVWTAALPGAGPVEYELGCERRSGLWLDYVEGVTAVLCEDGLRLSGLDVRIESSVPLGGGLSSSASLLVAFLRAIRSALGLALSDLDLAHLAHRAETGLVGAPVGIMDQFVASLGEPGSALYLDTGSMQWRRVPLPKDADLVVLDSGIRHAHASGEYGQRRAECTEAAAQLGVSRLCELGVDALPRAAQLPAPLDRRVRHVLTENDRVAEAVACLERGDLVRFGALLVASHESLRDDYEVSIAEIDHMVALARAEPAVFGARMTGGGFGGAIIALVRAGQGRAVADKLAVACNRDDDICASVLLPVSN